MNGGSGSLYRRFWLFVSAASVLFVGGFGSLLRWFWECTTEVLVILIGSRGKFSGGNFHSITWNKFFILASIPGFRTKFLAEILNNRICFISGLTEIQPVMSPMCRK